MQKYTYEVIESDFGTMIKRSDDAWIPTDPGNSDYQHYLRWLEDPEADQFTPTIEVTND